MPPIAAYSPADASIGRDMGTEMEHHQHLRLILDTLTTGATLGHIRATLNAIALHTTDEQLKTYLIPVRRVLASAVVQNMDEAAKVALPLERAPYSSLMAYCRRGNKKQRG